MPVPNDLDAGGCPVYGTMEKDGLSNRNLGSWHSMERFWSPEADIVVSP